MNSLSRKNAPRPRVSPRKPKRVPAPKPKARKAPRNKVIATKRRAGPPRRSLTMSEGTSSLSECSLKMLVAVSKPWDPRATGACIPTMPARSTQKVTAFTRFTVTIGSAGFGFALFCPTIANDQCICAYSNALFAGTTATPSTDATVPVNVAGVSFVNMTNLPYTNTQLYSSSLAVNAAAPLTSGRIVSFGASASYTGTELNKGGLVYCYSSPVRLNMVGATTDIVGSYADADIDNTTRGKCWLSMCPLDDHEMSFDLRENVDGFVTTTGQAKAAVLNPLSGGNMSQQQQTTYTSGTPAGSSLAACPGVMLFTGYPGNTFEVELVEHVEYLGILSQAFATPNVADPVGLNKVISAASKAYQIKASGSHKMSWSAAVMAGLQATAIELLPVAKSALIAALR